MSFTGSPEVGRLIAEACGKNLVPVKLNWRQGRRVIFDDERQPKIGRGRVTLNAGRLVARRRAGWCTKRFATHLWPGHRDSRRDEDYYGADFLIQISGRSSKRSSGRVLGYLTKG
jgi:aldehyde dehydrogenase (NAD+)